MPPCEICGTWTFCSHHVQYAFDTFRMDRDMRREAKRLANRPWINDKPWAKGKKRR